MVLLSISNGPYASGCKQKASAVFPLISAHICSVKNDLSPGKYTSWPVPCNVPLIVSPAPSSLFAANEIGNTTSFDDFLSSLSLWESSLLVDAFTPATPLTAFAWIFVSAEATPLTFVSTLCSAGATSLAVVLNDSLACTEASFLTFWFTLTFSWAALGATILLLAFGSASFCTFWTICGLTLAEAGWTFALVCVATSGWVTVCFSTTGFSTLAFCSLAEGVEIVFADPWATDCEATGCCGFTAASLFTVSVVCGWTAGAVFSWTLFVEFEAVLNVTGFWAVSLFAVFCALATLVWALTVCGILIAILNHLINIIFWLKF